jgi:RNA polymerase primary sigma factor
MHVGMFFALFNIEVTIMEMRKRKETSGLDSDDCLKAYFEQIKKNPLLSFEEELYLSKRIEQGDQAALDHLIESNLRLVVKIAMEYSIPEISILDLIQEGNMGLIKAATKYDFRKNVRFSTYASWWIKQAIMRAISNKRRPIRLPHRKEERLRKINRVFNSLYQSLMRKPSLAEIAEQADMSVGEVDILLNAVNPTVSFDKETTEDSLSLHEVYEDNTFTPDGEFMKKCLRDETMSFLERLMDKERKILMYRFSFLSGRRYTLKNIGEKLGMSPETVRQIELKALRKLRKVARGLKEYSHN